MDHRDGGHQPLLRDGGHQPLLHQRSLMLESHEKKRYILDGHDKPCVWSYKFVMRGVETPCTLYTAMIPTAFEFLFWWSEEWLIGVLSGDGSACGYMHDVLWNQSRMNQPRAKTELPRLIICSSKMKLSIFTKSSDENIASKFVLTFFVLKILVCTVLGQKRGRTIYNWTLYFCPYCKSK
jgi:hypothetical protein